MRVRFGRRFDEHLPKALRRQVVRALIGGSVAPDVGDGLAEFLDGNSEAIRFVVVDHGLEGVAVWKSG